MTSSNGKLISVTPERAKQWLAQSGGNRGVSERQVNALARDMLGGLWVDNGDSIKFSHDNVLMDGHHRLRAVLKAGVAVEMRTAHVDRSVMLTIDTGRKRTFADMLTLQGIPDARAGVAAACRLLGLLDLPDPRATIAFTMAELESIFKKNEAILTAGSWRKLAMRGYNQSGIVRPALYAFAARACGTEGVDAADVHHFLHSLAHGANLDEGGGVYLLTRWGQRSRARGAGARRPNSVVQYAIVVKAWNLHVDGERRETLYFRGEEAYPQIKAPIVATVSA